MNSLILASRRLSLKVLIPIKSRASSVCLHKCYSSESKDGNDKEPQNTTSKSDSEITSKSEITETDSKTEIETKKTEDDGPTKTTHVTYSGKDSKVEAGRNENFRLQHKEPETVLEWDEWKRLRLERKKRGEIDPMDDWERPREVEEFRNPNALMKREMMSYISNDYKPVVAPVVPRETDMLVIGGGALGSSIAYWLMQRNPVGQKIMVVERDPTYARAATALSVGGLRQQFSLPENVEMSLFTAEWLRDIKDHLHVEDQDPVDINFTPQGYLFLATDKGADTLERNYQMQIDLGAKIKKLSNRELSAKWPWINAYDIALATYGVENEGWFDPYSLLFAIRRKAMALGVHYTHGEVTGFKFVTDQTIGYGSLVHNRRKLDTAWVKYAEDGQTYPVKFAFVVNAAGPWAREVAQMAGIGGPESKGMMRIPIPIEPRKRYVYVIHCPDGPGLTMPMLIDPSGVYIRREGLGGHYVCGASPSEGEEPPISNTLDVNYEWFYDVIWPKLAHRLPAFESLKLKSAWAGFYDYNYFDQNLLLGNHPYHRNFFIAGGCSGHGIQHAPAIGRAFMEMIVDNDFQTIDLSRFKWDRVLDGNPIRENNII